MITLSFELIDMKKNRNRHTKNVGQNLSINT